jgi:hypothetical protein
MSNLAEHPSVSDPLDICMLLRAHGEHHWLLSELLPVLRQVEQPGSIPEDQLGAAYAYLEVLWLDAARRAAETDAACDGLGPLDRDRDPVLYEKARRYHAAVRRLRLVLGERVTQLTRPVPEWQEHQHARP